MICTVYYINIRTNMTFYRKLPFSLIKDLYGDCTGLQLYTEDIIVALFPTNFRRTMYSKTAAEQFYMRMIFRSIGV